MYFQTLDPVKMITNYDGFFRFSYENSSSNSLSVGQTIQDLVHKATEDRGDRGQIYFEAMTEDEYLKLLAARYIRTKSECAKSLNLQSSPPSGLDQIIIDINKDGTVGVSISKTNELRIITYFDFMRLAKGEAIFSQPICYALRQDVRPSAPEMPTITVPTNPTRSSVVTSQFAQFSNTGTSYTAYEDTKVYKNIDEVLDACDFHIEKISHEQASKLLSGQKNYTFLSRSSSKGSHFLAFTFKIQGEIHPHGQKKEILFNAMNINNAMKEPLTKSAVRAKLIEVISEHLVGVSREAKFDVKESFVPYKAIDKKPEVEAYSTITRRT